MMVEGGNEGAHKGNYTEKEVKLKSKVIGLLPSHPSPSFEDEKPLKSVKTFHWMTERNCQLADTYSWFI